MFAELAIIHVQLVQIQVKATVPPVIHQTIEFSITVNVNVKQDSITLKINLHVLHVTHHVKLVVLEDLQIVPLVLLVVLEI